MYGTKTIAGTGGAGVLASTGLHLGWTVLGAVVLVVCGATLVRLASSRPGKIHS